MNAYCVVLECSKHVIVPDSDYEGELIDIENEDGGDSDHENVNSPEPDLHPRTTNIGWTQRMLESVDVNNTISD